MMKDKRVLLISLALSPFFPLLWISEKGNLITTIDIFNYNFGDIFFDFSRLAINFLLLVFVINKFKKSFIFKKKKVI